MTLEKYLFLVDDFQQLPFHMEIFSQGILHGIMKNDSLSLDYYMKLLCRGPDAFPQFIDQRK